MDTSIVYYKGLITSQYQNSTKYLAWLEANLQMFHSMSFLLEVLDSLFDIDNEQSSVTAILGTEDGEEYETEGLETTQDFFAFEANQSAVLDIIGEIVGQSRRVSFQPSGGVSAVLDNVTYLKLLKAKIKRNHWDGKILSLYGIWQSIFPQGDLVVIDGQNMTINVIISGSFSSIEVDLIQHDYIIPRPEGVLMTYSFGEAPQFGFDLDNEYIGGFDRGKWVGTSP